MGVQDSEMSPAVNSYERVFALDEEALRCPYESFREARTECPVSHSAANGFWVVADHEHVLQVLKDTATFSTRRMLGPLVARQWKEMIEKAALRPEGKQAIGADYGSSDREVLLFADPPEHRRHRKLIMGALTAAAIRSWEDRIGDTARLFVDRLAAQPKVEFVEEFAVGYTMTVIADILGVPRDQVPTMLKWASGFNSMVGNPDLTEDEETALVDTRLGFDLYFSDQIAQREKRPTDDLISRIVELNREEGSELSNDEILMVLQLVMVGGSDTSSTALAKMIEYLAENPDRWNDLATDVDRIPSFMEEMLRTESPVQGMFRMVTQDVHLGGQEMKAGDFVWVSLGSANRDSKVFDDPDAKRFDRTGITGKYVSFGSGPHTCPGTALTRLELRRVLGMLIQRFAGVEFVAPRAPSKKSFLFFGPSRLDVRFIART
jgi:cytochrome P450